MIKQKERLIEPLLLLKRYQQIRTAVAGFADLCLTARPWYRVLITSAKVLLFLELARVDRVFLSLALHFVPVESTDKCKIKQSFCSTLLLMFQTFVLLGAIFLLYACHLLVHSPLAVAPPTTRRPFRKCTYPPASIPQRARVRCFSIFSFTSSPIRGKVLRYRGLEVKVSPRFPSPVKC